MLCVLSPKGDKVTSTNLLRLLAATAATFSIGAAHPQFNNWTGASGSNWSTAANWTAGVPVAGASLEFPAAANKTGVNDLVGLSLFRIDFTASGHVLSGNGVAITDGLRCANNVDSTAGFLVDMGAGNTVVTNRDGIALSCTVRATGGLAGSGTITVGAYTIFAVGGPSTFSGQIHLDECRNLGCGRLRLEGVSMPSANVFSSTPAQAGITAEISGNGTIGDATRVTMSPGTSTTFGIGNGVGVIATKNLDVSARLFNVDLAGPAAGSGYDQVAVTGTVTLGGASLKLRMAPGFAPPVGHVFTIVGNDGADAVIGAFAGLAEGAIITDKGFDLRLSYAGGDGNDVTLTVMVAPKVWTGAAGTLWSNPGNWAGGVVPQNGDRLRFPPGAANLTNTNDISGLVLHSVGFDGADYSLGGSGVVVTSLVESTILPDPMLGVTQFNTVAMPIDVQANAVAVRTESQLSYVRISGAISGTGPITIQSYTLSLQGSGGYSGTITLGCRTIDSLNPFLACGRLNLEGASYPFANVDSPGGFNSAGGLDKRWSTRGVVLDQFRQISGQPARGNDPA
jgi:hypothetical protein